MHVKATWYVYQWIATVVVYLISAVSAAIKYCRSYHPVFSRSRRRSFPVVRGGRLLTALSRRQRRLLFVFVGTVSSDGRLRLRCASNRTRVDVRALPGRGPRQQPPPRPGIPNRYTLEYENISSRRLLPSYLYINSP